MKQLLFVQGAGEGAHDQWDHKLVASLESELGNGYAVRYPRMPNEADPHFDVWKAELFSEFTSLEEGAIVVGHSIGGAFLIHALAEQPPRARLGGVFLIAAPFIGQGGWPSDEIPSRPGFSQRLAVGVPIFLYHGDADATVPVAHVHLYAKAISQAVVRIVQGRDHQLNNDMSPLARDIRS
jgi:predicted alpha/beta hydrolase family esterase